MPWIQRPIRPKMIGMHSGVLNIIDDCTRGALNPNLQCILRQWAFTQLDPKLSGCATWFAKPRESWDLPYDFRACPRRRAAAMLTVDIAKPLGQAFNL